MNDALPGTGLRIEATPRAGLLSERRRIVIESAVPGSLVTVRAETQRGAELWASQATFLVDREGRVDLDRSAPVSGDYRVADSMGLFWAQRRETANGGAIEPADVRALIGCIEYVVERLG